MGTVQDGMSSILTCEECVKDCEKKKNFTAAAAQTDADQKKPSKKRGSNMKKLLKKRGPILALVAVLILFGTVSGYNAATQKAKAEQDKKIEEAVQEALAAARADVAFTAEEITTEINMKIVLQDIRSIGELATVEYLYTDAGKFSNPKQLFGHSIPFTNKSFVMRWDGNIKAGIRNVSDITAEADEGTKVITVTLPKAELLSHTVDKESLEVLDENGGLFNPISVDDVSTFQKESEAATEQRALDNGILEKAQANAESLIRGLLEGNAIIKENYTIEFASN